MIEVTGHKSFEEITVRDRYLCLFLPITCFFLVYYSSENTKQSSKRPELIHSRQLEIIMNSDVSRVMNDVTPCDVSRVMNDVTPCDVSRVMNDVTPCDVSRDMNDGYITDLQWMHCVFAATL